MFDFFLGEAEHGAQVEFVAVELGLCVLDGQGDDVRLDEVEEVAVAVSKELVERALFACAEEAQRTGIEHGAGHEGFAKIEMGCGWKNIAELPRDALGNFNALAICRLSDTHGFESSTRLGVSLFTSPLVRQGLSFGHVFFV